MLDFYRSSFGKAGAFAYLGEGAVHITILATTYRLEDIPFIYDWYFATLATYCGIGLLWFGYTARIQKRNCCDTWAYVVTSLMTIGPVALHICIIIAHDHDILRIFSKVYSIIGLVYCTFFIWWLWTLRVERSHV